MSQLMTSYDGILGIFVDCKIIEFYLYSRYPGLTWQQAHNSPGDSTPNKDVENVIKNSSDRFNMFKWMNKMEEEDPCKLTLNTPQVITVLTL